MKENMFPKVNYIGNKEKLADWIVENLPISSGKVLDLFAGGGSVSYKLKEKGFQVISNDALYASLVLNKSLVENNKVKLQKIEIEKSQFQILNVENRKKLEFLSNTLYHCDEVDELSRLIDYSNTLKGMKRYLFQSLIRRAMIRKLPYSRMNLNWQNILKLRDEDYSYKKYGRKRAYHNQSFYSHILADFESYNYAVFDNGQKNKAVKFDGIEAINRIKNVDLVYLDPPYPNTMNKYDDFYGKFDEIFGEKISHLDLTTSQSFLLSIKEIVDAASHKIRYLALSLNSNSKPSLSEISNMLSFYGNVKVVEKQHNYQVSGKGMKNQNFEQLAILEFYR